ncbi:MAG: hypothetical protein ACW98Y_15975 [Candidatus Thorarchaeota archaeon]|jgi:hypothetical protein
MQRRIGLLLIGFLFILCNPTFVIAQESIEESAFIPEDLYDSTDLLDNPDFLEPNEGDVNGSSGEFSVHQNLESGFFTLNWTHTAGTELVYDNSSGMLPRCQDFAYLTQDFTWTNEVLPTFSNITLRYNVSTTGDFRYDFWPGMYEIQMWFIDPNHNWERINTFYGGSDETFTDWVILDGAETDSVFQSLIDEGPFIGAKLAICLVPSWRFYENYDTYPWDSYNGSVLVSFQYASMNVLFRTPEEFPKESEPLYELEWNQGDSDYYRDSCLTTDGRSLMLSTYEIQNQLIGSSLTYLDSRADMIWRKTWNDSEAIFWHDVCFFSDTIYLLGSMDSGGSDNDLQLRALDWQGEFLWSRNYDYAHSVYPRDLAISREGEIYIGFSGAEDYNRNHLLKVDLLGQELWEVDFGQSIWDDIMSVNVGDDGSVVTLMLFGILKWSPEGDRIWEIDGYFEKTCALADGSVITAQDYMSGALNITKFNTEGSRIWSQILSIQYSEGWYDYIGMLSMTQAYDGRIYLLIALGGYHPGRIILRIDSDGNDVGNTTVVFSEEIYHSFNQPQYFDVYISETNLVYLYGRILDREWDYSITVAVLGIEPLIIGSTGQAVITTVIAGSILIVTIVIMNWFTSIMSSNWISVVELNRAIYHVTICNLSTEFYCNMKINEGALMRPRIPIVLFLVLILLTGMMPVYAQEEPQNSVFVPTDLYDSMELLNNTDLEQPVDFGISGDSGEFSFSQNQSDGRVTLNWTHTAGTELEYDLTTERCLDFAYFSLEFPWNYTVTPTSSNLSLSYHINAMSDWGIMGPMYEIWTWLVHPNGTWMHLNDIWNSNFYGIEDEDYTSSRILGEWATEEVFQGLIESGPGDTSRLLIGLVPTWSFYLLSHTSEGRLYNGSVLISFQKVSMKLLYRTDNDFPTPAEPLYERSWKQGDYDFYYSSCITPDGYTYLLATYDISNIQYSPNGISLTKLNPKADVVWRKTWNGSDTVFWEDVAFHNNMVYLLGSSQVQNGGSDVNLTAIDWNGDFGWSKIYDYDYYDNPRGMEITDEGAIYVGCSSYDEWDHESDHLIKLSLDGSVIWESEFGLYDWHEIIDLDISSEGQIYTQTSQQIIQWNENGVQHWTLRGDNTEQMFILDDGSVLTTHLSYNGRRNLTKHTSDGELEWSQILSFRYSEGWNEISWLQSMTQGSDGIIYLLISLYGLHSGQLIIKMNRDGTQLENYTVAFSEELYNYNSIRIPVYTDIHVSSNNLVYLHGEFIHGSRWWNMNTSIIVSIHGLEPDFNAYLNEIFLTTGVATTAIIVTIVAWNIRQKKANQY